MKPKSVLLNKSVNLVSGDVDVLTKEFLQFVDVTDVTKDEDPILRERVARIGLVSEVGSILSALKKVILREDSTKLAQHISRGELREEIGDALWYVGMCANVLCEELDVFSDGLINLRKKHIGKSADEIRVEQLTEKKIEEFKKGIREFESNCTLDNYQIAAYCTRRTEDDELRDVCVAVLQQLTAQLVRCYMPKSEKSHINTQVKEKADNAILRETVWHLATLATLSGLKFSEIVGNLKQKTEFRGDRSEDVKHDRGFSKQESFPDAFEIAFVQNPNDASISEMFWLRKDGYHMKLGASLQDNHNDNDGYRYHDAIHVAFAVHLGWSPNLRKFMGLKRKSNKKVDANEDGGRAAILEEMIILQVHTYASKLTSYVNPTEESQSKSEEKKSPFEEPSTLTFEFIRALHGLSKRYEVFETKEGDWRNAICAGYDMFIHLGNNSGGVLTANTKKRTLTYRSLTPTEIVDTVGLSSKATVK